MSNGQESRTTPRSSARRRAAVFTLVGIAAVGPLLYPLWLALRTRRLSVPEPPEPREWPGITVVIPAYREKQVIAAKVQNVFDNDYPGPVEVLVVAEDEETSAAASETPARVINGGQRRGKAGALNVGVLEARMPVVVFTDANAMMARGALANAVRWLDDSTVGAVSGAKQVLTENGQSAYWTFESWLKQREAMTGTTIGVIGEFVALRRSDYTELPTDTAVDDFWLALDIVEQGKRIAYEPEARVFEDMAESPSAEWERRTRIVSGVMDALWRRRGLLVPGRTQATAQLWGHRLVRSSLGPLAHAALVALALRSSRRSRIARLFLGVHLFGIVALLRQRRGADPGRVGRALAEILFLQAAGIGGTFRWARGDRPALWPKPERVVRVDNSEAEARSTDPEPAPSRDG